VRTSDIKYAAEIKYCFIITIALTAEKFNNSTRITLQKMESRPNMCMEDQTDTNKHFSWHIIAKKVKKRMLTVSGWLPFIMFY
jgi:hypothetical protein